MLRFTSPQQTCVGVMLGVAVGVFVALAVGVGGAVGVRVGVGVRVWAMVATGVTLGVRETQSPPVQDAPNIGVQPPHVPAIGAAQKSAH